MDKVALVTGGSRGIGRQICLDLAKEGYRLIINYNKSEDKAKELLDELVYKKYDAHIYKADVSKVDEIASMFKYINEKYKRLDLLINNAGISYEGLVTDMDVEKWDNIMDTNVKSVFICSKEALKIMISQHSGKIINISSMWGICGASCEVAYSTSKAAVNGFTKALAKEVGPCNINVNAIAPGVIMTDMMNDYKAEDIESLKNQTPLMKLGSAKDISNLTIFLASSKADFITGQVFSSNGGFVI
ncbi:elongation factor P 5-aminopentanone reductase [Peptostreptococcus equinus]|uniref:SDR family oxidoreductase n=1 Tax=Peptostreptococcus equinus TaxID=3003601 RepID=A0ABY7JPY9_9FIRM|nr:SDR family oxidoreductase [Peptostreptococcus sp. CBA3647]WAW14228.1 SDR family oxidoreductase [Peptostreptococcus sp. CBA3647]